MRKSMAEEAIQKGQGSCRGHEILFENDQWVYADTKEPTPGFGGKIRPCAKCGSVKWSGDGEVDECVGVLPGVTNACCGHGDTEASYVCFSNGVVLRGFVVAEPYKKETAVKEDAFEKGSKPENMKMLSEVVFGLGSPHVARSELKILIHCREHPLRWAWFDFVRRFKWLPYWARRWPKVDLSAETY